MRNLAIIFLSPAVFLIFYDIIFNYMPFIENDYQNISFEYIYFMLFIDITSLLLFFILFFNKKKYKTKNASYLNEYSINSKWYLVIFIIICFLIHYLIYHVFGNIDYSQVITNYDKFYAVSKRGTAWIFYIINMLLMVLLYDTYINGFTKNRFSYIVLIVIMLAMTGGRSNVMILIILMLFIHIVIHNKKINLLLLSMAVIMISVFFVANTVLRAKTDLKTYLETKKSSYDFDQIYVLNDVIDMKNKGKITYMQDMEDLIFMFIPRAIWKNKPISTSATRLVYPDVANRGTSITFGLYANVLMNIGYFMFLLIPLFMYLFMHIYFRAICDNRKTFLNFLTIYFSINFIQFIRGGLIDTRILRILITMYFSYLIFKIIRKR